MAPIAAAEPDPVAKARETAERDFGQLSRALHDGCYCEGCCCAGVDT